MTPGQIVETVIGCAAFLSLVAALIAREAVKRGWVRFSLSFAVIPLDKRVEAPPGSVAAPKVIPGTVVHETGRAA